MLSSGYSMVTRRYAGKSNGICSTNRTRRNENWLRKKDGDGESWPCSATMVAGPTSAVLPGIEGCTFQNGHRRRIHSYCSADSESNQGIANANAAAMRSLMVRNGLTTAALPRGKPKERIPVSAGCFWVCFPTSTIAISKRGTV